MNGDGPEQPEPFEGRMIKMVQGYGMVLEGMGIDWKNDPHMKETPKRAAQAMWRELCVGLWQDPPKMTTFPLDNGKSEMIISKGIPVRSLCAHHLLPFIGEATVAYIPLKTVLGLSKLSRAVEHLSRRPQVQEKLTTDVADFLVSALCPRGTWQTEKGWGVGVIIRARHSCVELRGAQHMSDMTTSALRGEFLEPEVRAEFLSLAGAR